MAILFAAVVAAANLFVVAYIRHEHTLYYWDNALYWSVCDQMLHAWKADPLALLASALHTIRYYDYNDVPAFLPSLCSLVVGNSRAAYLLLATNLYALPALFVFLYLVQTIAPFPAARRLGLSAIVLALIGLSNVFWAPIVIGYIDVGGLILSGMILALYFGKPLGGQRWRRLAAIGILLGLLPLYRRWYGYWMIAFCVMAFCDLAIDALIHRARPRVPIQRLMAIGIPMAATIVLLSWPLPWRVAHEDLSFAYAAYRPPGGWRVSIQDSFGDIWRYFGPFICVPLIIGLVAFQFEPRRRRLGLFMAGLIVLATILLARITELGPLRAKASELGQAYQHLYVVLFPIMLVVCVFLCDLLHHRRPLLRHAAQVALAIVLCLSVLNFVKVFAPPNLFGTAHWANALSQMRAPPSNRNDIPQMRKLILALGQAAPGPDDRIYVLASSRTLNQDLLRQCGLSLQDNFPASQKLLPVSDIDQRDGFPRGLLNADVLLVAWPIQYHRRPQFQRAIGIPAQRVVDGAGFGSAFARLPFDFALERGVHAYIYHRIRPLTDADIRDLSDRLKAFYPDHPEIYNPN